MAASAYFDTIQKMYIAYFGRPADPIGLEFWAKKVDAAAGSLDAVISGFAASTESQALFGNKTSAEKVNAIYTYLFNRPAEPAGLTYWVQKLDSGEVSQAGAMYTILTNAGAGDVDAIKNKLAVANEFTKALDTTAEILGYSGANAAEVARTYLQTVNSTEASKTAALAAVNATVANVTAAGQGASGQTFTLTNGIDNVVGTSGNDTILAGSQNGSAALNAGDQINGGAGTDTLKIYDGIANFGLATVKSVEIVEDYSGLGAIDVSANADIKEVWLNKASTNAATAAKTQVIGFGDAAGGAAAVATFASAAGAADAATIAVKDAGKTTAYTSITVADIESLTVSASGSNQLGNLVAAAAETITFTGAGSVKATLVPGTTVLKSVDASANKGGVDLTLTDAQFGSNEIKVTGGEGNDKVTFTDALGAKATIDLGAGNNTLEILQGATALTAGSTFKAGAGTSDTLVLNTTTTAIDATSGKMFTGFENVVLKGTSSFQVGHIAGITGFEIAGGTATITKLAEASTVKVSANTTALQTLTLADNSAATASVKVVLDNGQTGKAAAAGVVTVIETNAHVLNVESKGNVNATVNAIDLTGTTNSLAQITNIVVTGDQAAKITTAAATALTLIDGSAATGKLELVATGSTKSMVIKGGSAADTITASDVADVVSTITAGKGADTITLGSTAANNKGDVIKLTSQADSTAAGFDKISNFAGGTTAAANADKIDLSAFGFTGAQAAMFTLGAAQVTVTGTAAAATFAIADTAAKDFFANAGADKGVALYTTGTETFVFVDADKNGDWNAATDSVILLVGNYTTDALTAGQFVFA